MNLGYSQCSSALEKKYGLSSYKISQVIAENSEYICESLACLECSTPPRFKNRSALRAAKPTDRCQSCSEKARLKELEREAAERKRISYLVEAAFAKQIFDEQFPESLTLRQAVFLCALNRWVSQA